MDPVDFAVAAIMVMSVGGGMWILVTIVKAAVAKWTRASQIEGEEVVQVREAISRLAGEVGELHERMDFAERMLSSQRQSDQLGDGA